MRRLALVVASIVMVAACGGDRPNLVDPGVAREVADSSPAPATVVERPVVRLAVDGWTGDPADAGPADLGRRVLADLLFEGLTRVDDGGAVRPALAEKWSVSEDRLTWIFTMSPEAVDSAGEIVTARTAMLSLDRLAARGPDDVVASALTAVSGWGNRMAGRAGGVAGITAPADNQLVIRLDRPFEPLIEVLASPAFGIVGAEDDELRSTGAYRLDDSTGELWPVDETSALPLVQIVDADPPEGAELLGGGIVDWAVLAPGSATDGLPGDVVRVPLDVSVGLAVRLDDPGARRSLLLALDSVALAGVVDLAPAPPQVPEPPGGELPATVTIDVPEGRLAPLGRAVAGQLAEAGIAAEVVVSDAAVFAGRVLRGEALVHPVVLAGGSWSAENEMGGLVPGGVNDLISIDSVDRVSLGASLTETRDLENRALFEELLEQTAVDEGVFLLIGNTEARVGVGPAAVGLSHRVDGTLDLSGVG